MNRKGSKNCTFCARGEVYQDATKQCVQCAPGYYSMHGWPYGKECLECPTGAICSGGDDLRIKRGYWVSGGHQENITQCGGHGGTEVRTCTYMGAIKRKNDVCKSRDGGVSREYFDACNMKRKITPCGVQYKEPDCAYEEKAVQDCIKFNENTALGCDANCHAQCEFDNRSPECIACYDPVGARPNSRATNSTEMLWHACNEADGYGGRLCQTCRTGYAIDPMNRLLCVKCPDVAASWALIVLGMFLAGGALSAFVYSHMEDAGSNSTSGATQKILLNYLQVVSIASEFPLRWPESVTGMFQLQQTISTFSDQLMNFDCEMKKRADILAVFWQKQIFFATLPFALLVVNILFWNIHRRTCQASSKKKIEHLNKTLRQQRLRRFKSLSHKALHHSRASEELDDSLLSHMKKVQSGRIADRLKEDMKAYKSAIDARSKGNAVKMARDLLRFLDTQAHVDIRVLITATDTHTTHGMDHYVTHEQFVETMVDWNVPYDREELLQICALLDPKQTGKITVNTLVAFHRTTADRIILSSSIIMFLLYPTICRQLFKLFSCRAELDPSPDDGYRLFQGLYLTHDLELPCYDFTHTAILMMVGIPASILYIFGFPLISLFAIRWHKNNWTDRAVYRYSMFLDGYKPEIYYWETLVAIRKAVIIATSVFLSSLGVYIQAYVVIFILAIFLGWHSLTRPFANEALNSLETYSLGFSFCTLYMGLLFNYDQFDTVPAGAEVLSAMIILMNVVFVIKTVRHLAKHFAGEGCSMVISSLGSGMLLEGIKWCYSCCCFLKKEEEEFMAERKRRKSHQKLTAVAPTRTPSKKPSERKGHTAPEEQGQSKEEQVNTDLAERAHTRRITMHTQAIDDAIRDAEAVKEYEARQVEKNREKLQKRLETRTAETEKLNTVIESKHENVGTVPSTTAKPSSVPLPVVGADGDASVEETPSEEQSMQSPPKELTLDDLKAVRQKHGGNSDAYKDVLGRYKKQEMEKAKQKLKAKKSYRQGKK